MSAQRFMKTARRWITYSVVAAIILPSAGETMGKTAWFVQVNNLGSTVTLVVLAAVAFGAWRSLRLKLPERNSQVPSGKRDVPR